MAEEAADDLPSISEPQSMVVSPTAYARSAYSLYASHTPSSGPASACLVREAGGQQCWVSCVDPMEVFSEAWAGRSGRLADLRDHDYGAKRDGYAGAGMCFKPSAHYGFSTGYDGDRAVTRAPVSAVDYVSSMGTTRMPVEAAKLAPLGIPSALLATTGIPGPE